MEIKNIMKITAALSMAVTLTGCGGGSDNSGGQASASAGPLTGTGTVKLSANTYVVPPSLAAASTLTETTFTLPKVLDALNNASKPYIYYMEETAAGTGSFATYYGELTDDGVKKKNGSLSAQNGEVIINQESSGYELPSTGGPGTNLFYLLGCILILGAGILFIRKRRFV